MRIGIALFFMLAFAATVQANELNLVLKTSDGKPITDAVVTVHPAAAPKDVPVRFSWSLVVEQRDLKFQPFVLIAPAGADVSFPNFDSVRHHVYSFSKPNPFELRLFGKDESRRVRNHR